MRNVIKILRCPITFDENAKNVNPKYIVYGGFRDRSSRIHFQNHQETTPDTDFSPFFFRKMLYLLVQFFFNREFHFNNSVKV